MNCILLNVCAALLLATSTPGQATPHTSHGSPSFQEREQQVMPFDLRQTRHVFERTASGGVQRVLALRANDARNKGLIRSHLQQEALRFSRGDFGSPTYLHGEEMAGLALLKRAAREGRVTVRYTPIALGAALTYHTKDAAVTQAIHAWFAAQVQDHGGQTTLK